MAALAGWGLVAAGWILFGDGARQDATDSSSFRPSLAVLPFDNLSPDPDNAYFAAGIHEEVLTQLSRIEGIKLISRTSVLSYEDTEKRLSEIAEELGVSTISEGSVQRAGDEVRVTVQLNDAREDEHLWAERYDRELSDIFQIQTEVATRVVEELKGVLTPEERAELARRPTDDMQARPTPTTSGATSTGGACGSRRTLGRRKRRTSERWSWTPASRPPGPEWSRPVSGSRGTTVTTRGGPALEPPSTAWNASLQTPRTCASPEGSGSTTASSAMRKRSRKSMHWPICGQGTPM
ncbi:MAG: hypothetical protein GWM92_18730 [Gemmatimonadetes bacterium]|nr:hypothetical protein [Gemmatimonadota bacterium]NIT89655.1 hypothetical protein [Gemmatimonadota bacterium]NIU33432.1 hypothetical protein [Gemmatimonadota bacterium]NIU37723.1 hypothetical protein [Gemmatimonadota bacterium]NIV63770.1 hypothetical protein [Gemmatimonadota bacterium]